MNFCCKITAFPLFFLRFMLHVFYEMLQNLNKKRKVKSEKS